MKRLQAMTQFSHHFLRRSSTLSAVFVAGLNVGIHGRSENVSVCENKAPKIPPSSHQNRIIFLGTGSSTGCPKPLCTMLFNSSQTSFSSGSDKVFDEMRDIFRNKCDVSKRAIVGNPLHNKDYRNNPSLLIAQYDEKEGRMKHIIIDVGKTFRETALRWFPKHGINTLDAVILTHEHADASFGLDDVRGFQRVYPPLKSQGTPRAIPMKVFMSQPCLDKLSISFPWLFPQQQKKKVDDPSKPVVERFVSKLDLHIFESFEKMDVESLRVVTLPVMHGEDLVSYGFAFKVGSTNVVYLSDISRMLPETMHYIQNHLPPTDILIVDSLHQHGTHPVHFSMEQAVELAKEIKPKQTFIVGINCDAFLPHDEMNERLQQEYGNVQLAHDGLSIEC